MTAREWFAHIQRINGTEIPQLPPNFNADQSLANDELTDIILHSFPKTWQAEMDKQGFDPMLYTPQATIDFCERLETAEQLTQTVTKKRDHDKKKGNSKSSKKTKSDHDQSKGDKYCMLHGWNKTHTTDECNSLKGMLNDKQKSGDFGGKKNKTWSRKAEEAKKKSKKDLHALMQETVRKELHSMMDKKRKANDDSSEEGEVSDDNQSINVLENVDLSEFNYQDMDNLKIDSEDEEFQDAREN